MLSEIEGYRVQRSPKAVSTPNSNGDPASMIGVIHYLHEHCHGILDDNLQLMRAIAFVGIDTADLNYIYRRHAIGVEHRVLVPVNFTEWTSCGAVVCRGPLTAEQDKFIYDTAATNTNNTYRNFAFIHSVPTAAILHPNDYDIYTACRRYTIRYCDMLGQACGHQLYLNKIFPGGSLRPIFNGSTDADWSSVALSYNNNDHKQYLHLRLVCY